MVDVSEKDNTLRVATASGIIEVGQEAYNSVVANTAKKGPVPSNCRSCGHTGHQTNEHSDPHVSSFDAHLGKNRY